MISLLVLVIAASEASLAEPPPTQNEPVWFHCTAEWEEYRRVYVSNNFRAPLDRSNDIRRGWIDRLHEIGQGRTDQYDLSSVGCRWNADEQTNWHQRNDWIQNKANAGYQFREGSWVWNGAFHR